MFYIAFKCATPIIMQGKQVEHSKDFGDEIPAIHFLPLKYKVLKKSDPEDRLPYFKPQLYSSLDENALSSSTMTSNENRSRVSVQLGFR